MVSTSTSLLFVTSCNAPIHLTMLLASLVLLTAEECPLSVVPVSDRQQSELHKSQLRVSAELLHTLTTQHRLENVLLSPFTIHSALLLLFFAASGDTEQLLRKILHIPNTLSKDTVLGQYIKERHSNDSTHKLLDQEHEFLYANRMYVENGLHIRKCMKSFFPKEYHTADLKFRMGAKDIMLWITNATNGNIVLNLPSVNELSFNTIVKPTVSINAAYLKGIWFNQFSKNETKNGRFYTNNETFVEVDMMTTTGFFTLWASKNSSMKILELPYNNKRVSMIIMMPNKKHHKNLILEFLQSFTSESFVNILQVLSKKFPSTILVRIPKIVTEAEYNLEEVLKHLGGDLLFGAVAHFEDLLVKNRYITVLKTMVHKAKIEVDEEGSGRKGTKKKYKKKFIANRPFVYFIYEKKLKIVLFSGVFYSP